MRRGLVVLAERIRADLLEFIAAVERNDADAAEAALDKVDERIRVAAAELRQAG